ncbi:putative mitogen-activated protein kinase kinase kinase STE-STE11 family [Helianthus annuus]|nr:putative mitogen-activated protein kinase kinase kinase STE-STE11 family [Helianthus annuus]
MFTKQKRSGRKLDRKNAFKNVDYDASTSSSSSSFSLFDTKPTHRAPSLDSSPFPDQISHRIEGTAGEVESIFRSLGLSGPEDLAIPVADWEAHKACCSVVSCTNTLGKVNDDVSRIELSGVEVIGRSRMKGVRPPPVLPVIVDKHWEDPVRVHVVRESTGLEYLVSPNGTVVRCSIKNWQKGDFLGSGSFGTVYEGFNEYGFFFAVKEVSLLDQGSQGKQSILQLEQVIYELLSSSRVEIFLLSQFQHDNIVRYLGTDKDDGKLYIFLELVPKGSLANLYQKYRLRDSQVSTYTRQILSGLSYLHDRNVVHRDIKCANILVDVSGSVKLADFGLAKATKLNDIKSCKGTPYWMAPEVVNNKKNKGYGPAADIWSLGCTVLEMLTGRVPYSHLEGVRIMFSCFNSALSFQNN